MGLRKKRRMHKRKELLPKLTEIIHVFHERHVFTFVEHSEMTLFLCANNRNERVACVRKLLAFLAFCDVKQPRTNAASGEERMELGDQSRIFSRNMHNRSGLAYVYDGA